MSDLPHEPTIAWDVVAEIARLNLAHATRRFALRYATEHETFTIKDVAEALVADAPDAPSHALESVAYHVRELHKTGALLKIGRPRLVRGSAQQTYQADPATVALLARLAP